MTPLPQESAAVTEQTILTRLQPLVQEVTGAELGAIVMSADLMMDLGAESLDLLDLSFLIEEQFGVTLEPNEIERTVTERLEGGEYEKDGFLTDEALEELARLLPEVDRSRFAPGLRKTALPSLLTVGVFVHLIQRRLEAQPGEHSC